MYMHKTSSLNLLIITKQTPIYSLSTIPVKNRAEASVHAHSHTFCYINCGFLYFYTTVERWLKDLGNPPTRVCLISSVVMEMQVKTILKLMSLQIGII